MDHQVTSTLAELHRAAFNQFPDRIALACGSDRLTYAELNAEVNRAARFLKGRGLGRGHSLAMLSGNMTQTIAVSMACQILGLRYTALHPLGSEGDQAFVLEDASIDALVVDAARFGVRGATLASRGIVDRILTLGPADFGSDIIAGMAQEAGDEVPIEARAEDIAILSYTGGTTGRPKGVIHRHRAVINLVLQELAFWEWPNALRFLAATPISHAAGAILAPVLLRGGTFHFLETFTPTGFLETVERERITGAFLVPTIIYGLLDHPDLGLYNLSSLETVIYGAAPMSPARLQQAIDRFGPIFCQLYGQSEAANTLTYLSKGDHLYPERLASCGRPIPGNLVKVLNGDDTEAAPNEVGEICARALIAADGYLNCPDESARAFRDGWLRTGDMAYRDENGYLYIVDRAKDLIISGGFNVYPREIEDCLSQHPDVAMAAVIGVPDEKWGEAVLATVVLKPGAATSADDLIAFTRKHKGVVYAPKRVEFLNALPLTAVGKLDKKALRQRYWQDASRQVA